MKVTHSSPDADGAFEDIGAYAKLVAEDGCPLLARLMEKGADEYASNTRKRRDILQFRDEVKRIATLLF